MPTLRLIKLILLLILCVSLIVHWSFLHSRKINDNHSNFSLPGLASREYAIKRFAQNPKSIRSTIALGQRMADQLPPGDPKNGSWTTMVPMHINILILACVPNYLVQCLVASDKMCMCKECQIWGLYISMITSNPASGREDSTSQDVFHTRFVFDNHVVRVRK